MDDNPTPGAMAAALRRPKRTVEQFPVPADEPSAPGQMRARMSVPLGRFVRAMNDALQGDCNEPG